MALAKVCLMYPSQFQRPAREGRELIVSVAPPTVLVVLAGETAILTKTARKGLFVGRRTVKTFTTTPTPRLTAA